MYTAQLEIERQFDKSQINQWIIDEVSQSTTGTSQYRKAVRLITAYLSKKYYPAKDTRLSEAFADLTVQEVTTLLFASVLPITTPSRTSAPIQSIATQLGLKLHKDTMSAVKTGAELLAVCEPCGLYTIVGYFDKTHDHDSALIVPNFALDEETQFKIHATQYLPPMLCEPRQWTANTKGGYLNTDSSCILGSGNTHNRHQSLDVLNKLQSIEWELNLDMLDTKDPEAKPQKSTESVRDYKRRLAQHNIATEQSSGIYDLMLNNNNSFYFVWKFDKRGRMYSQGYDINLQGSEYKKSILNMKHSEALTGL